MAAIIGALRGVLSLDSAAFEKGAKRAQASLTDLQRNLRAAGDGMRAAGRSLTRSLTVPLAGMATVAVTSSLKTIDAQAKLAQSLGTTVESLQILARAGDMAGLSTEELEGSLRRFTRRVSLAEQGTGPAVAALDRLGISAETLDGIPLDQRIDLVLSRLRELVPEAEQAGVATQLFGDKSGLAFARLDSATLKTAADQISRFGVAVSEVDADQIERTNDAVSALGLVTRGLSNQLAAALAPVIETVALKLQDLGAWFSSLSDGTKRAIAVTAGFAAALGPVLIGLGLAVTAISAIASPVTLVIGAIALLATGVTALVANWDTLTERFPVLGKAAEAVGRAVRFVGERMEGLRRVAEVLVRPVALVGAVAIEAGRALVQRWQAFRAQFDTLGAALVAMGQRIGGALGALWDGIKTAGAGALEALGTALRGLNALIDGDLTGAFAAAKALIESFKAAFGGLGVAITQKMRAALNMVTEFLSSWSFAAVALDLAQTFIDGWREIGPGVVAALRAAWVEIEAELRQWGPRLAELAREAVTGFSNPFNAASKVGTNLGKGIAERLVEGVKDRLKIRSPSRVMEGLGEETVAGFVQGIERTADDAVRAAEQMATDTVDGMTQVIDGLPDVIGTAFSGLYDRAEDVLADLGQLFRDSLGSIARDAANTQIRLGVEATGVAGAEAQAAALQKGGGGILGQLGGLVSGFTSGIESVVTGLFSKGLSGAVSAVATAVKGIGTASSVLSGLATAAGAIAAPLLAVSAIVSLLRKKTEVLQTGLELTVGNVAQLTGASGTLADSLSFTVKAFERIKTSNAVSADISKNFSDAGEAGAELNRTLGAIYDATFAAAEALGYSRTIFLDYFRDWEGAVAQFDLKGKDAAGIQQEITRRLAQHIDYVIEYGREVDATTAELVDALDRMKIEGEGTYDALVRVAQQFTSVSTILSALDLGPLSEGIVGAEQADALAKLLGGLDGFVSAVDGYTQRFYSEAERAAIVTEAVRDALADFNVSVPRSRVELRRLVEAQDLTTEGGRALFAALVGLSEQFDLILPKASQLSAELATLFGDVQATVDAELAAARSLVSSADQAADLWARTADTLRDVVRDLQGTDLGGRAPVAQLEFNRKAFEDAAAAARGGDVTAAQALPGLARAFLASAQATAQTSSDFRAVADRIRNETALVAGVAQLESGKQSVLARLYEKHIEVSEAIRAWLTLEGASDAQLATLDDSVRALAQDWDGTLAGFQKELAGLEAAIRSTSELSYDSLKERLQVTVDVLPRADIPDYLKALIGSEAGAIARNVDFILRRNDLSPDLVFLAVNALDEASKVVRFLVREGDLTPGLIRIALNDVTELRKGIRFAVEAPLDAETKVLALSGGGELLRTVRAILGTGADPRALKLALETVGGYAVAVSAALDPGVADGIRKLVLERTPTYTAGILAVLQAEKLSEPARRALLTQQGDYVVNIARVLTDQLSDRKRELLLEATTSGFRVLSLRAFDGDLTPRQRRLLFDDEPEVRATIRAALDETGLGGDARRFLRAFTATADPTVRRIAGRIDLDAPARDNALLLDRLLGAADGKLALSANVRIDPSKTFADLLDPNTAELGKVLGAIRTLRDVLREGTEATQTLTEKVRELKESTQAAVDAGTAGPVSDAAVKASISDAFRVIFGGLDMPGVVGNGSGVFHTGGIVGEENITALRGEGVFTRGQMAALAPVQDQSAVVAELRTMSRRLDEIERLSKRTAEATEAQVTVS